MGSLKKPTTPIRRPLTDTFEFIRRKTEHFRDNRREATSASARHPCPDSLHGPRGARAGGGGTSAPGGNGPAGRAVHGHRLARFREVRSSQGPVGCRGRYSVSTIGRGQGTAAGYGRRTAGRHPADGTGGTAPAGCGARASTDENTSAPGPAWSHRDSQGAATVVAKGPENGHQTLRSSRAAGACPTAYGRRDRAETSACHERCHR